MSKRYFSSAKLAGAGLDLALPAVVGAQRILNHIKLTNDKAATYMSIYRSTVKLPNTTISLTGQKIILMTNTTGFAIGDTVIVQHASDPTLFEIHLLAGVAAGVSITTTANLTNTMPVGSNVYGVITGGGASLADWIIPVGIATVSESNATAVFVSDEDIAVLMRMDSVTATCNYMVTGFTRS